MLLPSPEAVADALFSAWNSHDIDRIMGHYASDIEMQDVAQAQTLYGWESMRRNVVRYLDAFPDLRFTPTEMISREGRVVLVWTASGTHQGALLNIPATGRPVLVRGVTLLTIERGQVTHETAIWDLAGLLRSIGLLPDL